jgi:cytochrome c-type biogenesis protein CcmH
MKYLVCIWIILSALGAHANSYYPLATKAQQVQLEHLFQDLRCLVCQNQNLADSNAPLAQDLRQEIYQLVKAGQGDEDIGRYLSARYGDFIFFKPPLKSFTVLLWFGPFMFLALGCLLFWRRCLRRG